MDLTRALTTGLPGKSWGHLSWQFRKGWGRKASLEILRAVPSALKGSVDFGPEVTSSDKSLKVLLNAEDKVSTQVPADNFPGRCHHKAAGPGAGSGGRVPGGRATPPAERAPQGTQQGSDTSSSKPAQLSLLEPLSARPVLSPRRGGRKTGGPSLCSHLFLSHSPHRCLMRSGTSTSPMSSAS